MIDLSLNRLYYYCFFLDFNMILGTKIRDVAKKAPIDQVIKVVIVNIYNPLGS